MLYPIPKEEAPRVGEDSSGATAIGSGKPKSQGVCILQAFFGQVNRYDTETKSSQASTGGCFDGYGRVGVTLCVVTSALYGHWLLGPFVQWQAKTRVVPYPYPSKYLPEAGQARPFGAI